MRQRHILPLVLAADVAGLVTFGGVWWVGRSPLLAAAAGEAVFAAVLLAATRRLIRRRRAPAASDFDTIETAFGRAER